MSSGTRRVQRLSSTYRAPVPPSGGIAEQNASTSERARSHRSTCAFMIGKPPRDPNPLPWTIRTQRLPRRRESSRNRSSAAAASDTMRPCRSRSASILNRPRRSLPISRRRTPPRAKLSTSPGPTSEVHSDSASPRGLDGSLRTRFGGRGTLPGRAGGVRSSPMRRTSPAARRNSARSLSVISPRFDMGIGRVVECRSCHAAVRPARCGLDSPLPARPREAIVVRPRLQSGISIGHGAPSRTGSTRSRRGWARPSRSPVVVETGLSGQVDMANMAMFPRGEI